MILEKTHEGTRGKETMSNKDIMKSMINDQLEANNARNMEDKPSHTWRNEKQRKPIFHDGCW